MLKFGEYDFHCQILTVKKINLTVKNVIDSEKCHLTVKNVIDSEKCHWQWKISPDSEKCTRVKTFTVSDISHCQMMIYFTVKKFSAKNEFKLVTYKDASKSWLFGLMNFVKKYFLKTKIWKTIISERLDVKIAIEDITYTLVRVVDIWQDVSADPC